MRDKKQEVKEMRNIVLFICLVMIVFSAGCGQKSSVVEKAYPMKVDAAKAREFNSKLAAIKDEASAEQAVNSFVGYVVTRLAKPASSIQPMSTVPVVSADTIRKIAHKEAAIRGCAAVSVMSEGGQQNGDYQDNMFDIGTVTDNINQLGKDRGIRVDDETVSIVKVVVEGSIPNINPRKSYGITPLEAMVVSYAVISGDDGTATTESVGIPADRINAFVENIAQ
jgi:hypothetical protein